MAMFTSFGRRRDITGGDASGRELTEDVRRSLPARFEAVGEALASAADVRPACAVVGRDVARDGAALGEALDGLRTTFDVVAGTDPDFAATEALSVAWSEATLEFLHDLSCEDPLTGMTSLAHVRTRLEEVYREHAAVGSSAVTQHALVVVEMSAASPYRRTDHQFTRALHLVRVTEAMRTVFPGGETIGRLGTDRAVAVVTRDAHLGEAVMALRDLLTGLDLGASAVRVWIEGLPATADSAARLLDDLAR